MGLKRRAIGFRFARFSPLEYFWTELEPGSRRTIDGRSGMEGAMAVAWRSTCLILLLVANFHLATVVQAQTDHSFNRWLDARERLAKELAAEMGISVEKAIMRIRRGNPVPENKFFDFVPDPSAAELRQADLEQYEKDKTEATARGTTVEVVLTGRLALQRALAQLALMKNLQAEKRIEKNFDSLLQGLVPTAEQRRQT